MMCSRAFSTVIAGLLFAGTCFAEPVCESLTKRRVLSDLDTIQNIFEVKYAPQKWKGEFANWDISEAILKAKDKIKALPNPSLKECQIFLRDFFNSTQDYHVGVNFYSTESASLPFSVKGADNRYFVCEVDHDQIGRSTFPFEVGDEILTFDGLPVHDAIDALRIQEYGSNTYETDLALATMLLTNRTGEKGNIIPQGSVTITGKKRGEDKVFSTNLIWNYVPEKIRDLSSLCCNMEGSLSTNEWTQDFGVALKKSGFFDKCMVFHNWNTKASALKGRLSNHMLGSRSSYLPALGKKIWQSGFDWLFDAYIFETDSGLQIGYIRIPHYAAGNEELEEWGQVINFLNKKTDALVIDQLNNPGGSIFYLYALVSTLIDKPITAPKHQLTLTQEEVQTALFMLPYLELVKDNFSARTVLGSEIGGYHIDYEFACLTNQFCEFIISQWNQGKLYTDLTHLFGVNEIKPSPFYHYSKPILLLINSLNFSGGDFFPAIMKDSKRATLIGTRTAGAGGYVITTEFPNQSGIKDFALTGSLAQRVIDQPIENLGVQPDIVYDLTVEDLQSHYQPYIQTIVKTVESLAR